MTPVHVDDAGEYIFLSASILYVDLVHLACANFVSPSTLHNLSILNDT